MLKTMWLVLVLLSCAAPRPEPSTRASSDLESARTVLPGTSLQAAIDASEPGAVIRLVAGAYPERITITKPLTLIGAGWDATEIGPHDARPTPREPAETQRVSRAPRAPIEPTLSVQGATNVVVRGVKFRGLHSGSRDGGMSADGLVRIDAAGATLQDCAVLGPCMTGIEIRAGSDVQLERTLIAAFWNTGVVVGGGDSSRTLAPPRVRIRDCDVRNCFHRCITIASDDVIVERSRISGSAWHGIRYDGCSPSIEGNVLFRNARFGIYASGPTHASVKSNVFFANEMEGMSCWFANVDTIEGNTFVANARGGLSVLGASRPNIVKNLFVENPIAVSAGKIADQAAREPAPTGSPALQANVLWANPIELQVDGKKVELPPGNDTLEPGFVARAELDFALSADSGARRRGVGAGDPISIRSPFPIQPEEREILPDSEGRDFRLWKE